SFFPSSRAKSRDPVERRQQRFNGILRLRFASLHSTQNDNEILHSGSPTISTSVSNSIPRFFLATLLMSSINSSTSDAVASPSFTIKLPCTRDTRAFPTREFFSPNSSTNLPAGIVAGFLKMQPALLAAGWVVRRFS